MKRIIIAALSIALMITVAACKESSNNESIVTDVSAIPVLIDRGILIDAAWGIGEGIPADVACVAGSQLEFNATDSAFFISLNDGSDPHFVTPAIITSSLAIEMPADEIGSRSEACAVGDLSYIISATPDIPIDIEFRGEDCANVSAVGNEPVLFPSGGTVTAHIEMHEVDVWASSCQSDDTDDSSASGGGAPAEEIPPADDTTDDTVVEETTPQDTNDVSENGNPESTGDDSTLQDSGEATDEVVEEETVEDVVEEVVEEETVVEEVVVEEEDDGDVEEVVEEIVEEIIEEEDPAYDDCYYDDCEEDVIVDEEETVDEVDVVEGEYDEDCYEDDCCYDDSCEEDVIIVEEEEDIAAMRIGLNRDEATDTASGCPSKMVKMFKLVIDSCGSAATVEEEPVAEVETE